MSFKKNKEKKKSTSGSGGFKIINESGIYKPDNKPMIFAILGCICLIIALIIFAFFFFGKKDNNSDYEDYQKQAVLYEKRGIEYSYDDYKKDKALVKESETELKETEIKISETKNNNDDNNDKSNSNTSGNSNSNSANLNNNIQNKNKPDNKNVNILPDGSSDAKKDYIKTNDDILNDAEEDNNVKINSHELALSIIQQTYEMNNFINNHCGYPDDEYPDEEYYKSKEYIDLIVKSMVDGSSFDTLYGESISQLQAEVRYSILNLEQYHTGNGNGECYDCLNSYISLGYPYISSIDSITIERIDNNEIWDNSYVCDLKAEISSYGNYYTVYLGSEVLNDGTAMYKVLDIE